MKRLSVHLTMTCAVLLSSQAMAADKLSNTPTIQQLISALDDHFASTRTPQQLILALDTKALARKLNKRDTYTSLFDPKGPAGQSSGIKTNIISKKLRRVSKAFKRISTIRTGKMQKIRAKVGKSSLTLKYTRIL